MNRKFSVYVSHPKGVNIVWTCVKDNIIQEKIILKPLDYRDLIINYLKKIRVWGLERDYTGILI